MDLEKVRERAAKAIQPIAPATEQTKAEKNFLFDAKRTDAGRNLPPYYLVYFLLVDLLKFKNLGQFEKIAWSVPIDFKGRAFLIEHRKFGLGIFAADLPADESDAEEIAKRIRKTTRSTFKQGLLVLVQPYRNWRKPYGAGHLGLRFASKPDSTNLI